MKEEKRKKVKKKGRKERKKERRKKEKKKEETKRSRSKLMITLTRTQYIALSSSFRGFFHSIQNQSRFERIDAWWSFETHSIVNRLEYTHTLILTHTHTYTRLEIYVPGASPPKKSRYITGVHNVIIRRGQTVSRANQNWRFQLMAFECRFSASLLSLPTYLF